jgi:hypothetical protein
VVTGLLLLSGASATWSGARWWHARENGDPVSEPMWSAFLFCSVAVLILTLVFIVVALRFRASLRA